MKPEYEGKHLEIIFGNGGWILRLIRTHHVISVLNNLSVIKDFLIYLEDMTDIDFGTDSLDKIDSNIDKHFDCRRY